MGEETDDRANVARNVGVSVPAVPAIVAAGAMRSVAAIVLMPLVYNDWLRHWRRTMAACNLQVVVDAVNRGLTNVQVTFSVAEIANGAVEIATMVGSHTFALGNASHDGILAAVQATVFGFQATDFGTSAIEITSDASKLCT